MPEVAATTADGTTLPEALRIHGVELDERQLRALYRNAAFKEMRLEARREWMEDKPADVAEGRDGHLNSCDRNPASRLPTRA
jgi:hypothetical protein